MSPELSRARFLSLLGQMYFSQQTGEAKDNLQLQPERRFAFAYGLQSAPRVDCPSRDGDYRVLTFQTRTDEKALFLARYRWRSPGTILLGQRRPYCCRSLGID